jgi:hypothetical protein
MAKLPSGFSRAWAFRDFLRGLPVWESLFALRSVPSKLMNVEAAKRVRNLLEIGRASCRERVY